MSWAAAALANIPGHPAVRIGADHKRKFEAWMAEMITDAGLAEPELLARQIVLLMDGAFSTMLIHRDPAYAEAAGTAAAAMVRNQPPA